jgi:hypothetical protein
MPSKVGVAIAGVALAMFVGGRAGLGRSPVAWAQEAQDQAADLQSDEAAAQDGEASQDESAAPQDESAAQNEAEGNEPSAKSTPVSASGVYSGTVMDANQGAGTISAAISQIRGRITGAWQDTFVPPAFIAGTLSAKGTMSLHMRFHITGNCGYLFSGVFQNGDEISGKYNLTGCKGMKPDHGSLDMIKQ